MKRIVVFVALALFAVGCGTQRDQSPAAESGVVTGGYDSPSSGSYDDAGSSDGYPAYDGYDLDCADIGHPVEVGGDDPHGLDRDGDGIGCETW